MSGNAVLTGYPPVIRLDFYQGTDERPGRLVIDTAVTGVSNVPMFTTLTLFARSQTFTWTNLRCVKSPRLHRGFMRTVFEDSRWTLKRLELTQSFNRRDIRGVIDTASERTESQLWTAIATAGISITAAESGLKPLCSWDGIAADKAAGRLLRDTVCRMVYDPVAQTYHVSAAGTGSLPDLTQRLFRPGPDEYYTNVHVDLGPTVYEDAETCEAMVVDEDGIPETMNDSGFGMMEYFNGYDNESDVPARTKMVSSAYRIWRIKDADDKHFLSHRGLSVQPTGSGGVPLGIFPYDEGIYDWERGQTFYRSGVRGVPIRTTIDRRDNLLITDLPVIKITSGTPQWECDFAIAHYKGEDGNYARRRKTATLGGSGGSLVVTVPYLNGYESTISDSDAAEDASVDVQHEELLDRHETRLSAKRQNVWIGTLVPHGGSGQVGAVRYRMWTDNVRRRIDTQITFNYRPPNAKGMT